MSKYDPKYDKRCMLFSVRYRIHDIEEGQRLKDYLTDTQQTANSYLKKLIKADLDKKGV